MSDTHREACRFLIAPEVPLPEVADVAALALVAVGSLHGDLALRLDTKHWLEGSRRLVVDASTPAGHDYCRILAGYLERLFGPGSFKVERDEPRRPATAKPAQARARAA